MADEIKFIVSALNRAPFYMKLSLVSFHAKKGVDLLQVVNDVYGELDVKHKKDIRDESPAEMGHRMLEFAVVLNYKSGMDLETFNEQFLKSETGVIYPFLYWMLSRIPDLKKRAYLQRFLRPVVIPEEFFADDVIINLVQKYKESQEEFKEVHKILEKARAQALAPGELEKDIKQLELETEQLDTKLGRLKEKVDNGPEFHNVNFEQLLQATHLLRKEQEEEAQLHRSLKEQRHRLEKSNQGRRLAQMKLKELESSNIATMDPRQVLGRLRQEVGALREKCNERLEKEIRERERTLREISRAITSEPLSLDVVRQMDAETQQLDKVVQDLRDRRDASQASADGAVKMGRERLAAAEKKREKVLEQVQELEQEKKELDTELEKLNEDLQKHLVDGKPPMTEHEMHAYTVDMHRKLKEFKAIKAQLKAAKDEVVVLQNTEAMLRSRDEKLEELLQEMEREKGVEGYAATQDKLESVAQQQAVLNQSKGQTLEEISNMVMDITKITAQKKAKLTPLLKEFKELRGAHEELEEEYREKKRTHDHTALALQAERRRIEQEISNNEQAMVAEENSYHFLNNLSAITQVRIEQMQQEDLFQQRKGRLSQKFKTYQDFYEQAIVEEDGLSKQLREEKKEMKDTHEKDVGQRKMFTDLQRLVRAKLDVTKRLKESTVKQKQTERENYLNMADIGKDLESIGM